MSPSIEQIREQCRLDADDSSEDNYLASLAKAAKKKAENFINRKLYVDEVSLGDPDGLLITEDVNLALLLVIAHWYENREDSSDASKISIPLGFTALLEPYKFITL